MTRKAAALLLTVLASASTARAQTEHDRGLWFMLFGTGSLERISDRLSNVHWWLDIQPRFTDDADGLKQFLLRPGLGHKVTDTTIAWLGYAWIETERRGSSSDFITENRIWQQFTWAPKLERFGFSSRTRLEQRFLENGSDVGWRFRQFFKATYPIAFERRLGLAAYEEAMFNLNDTDWGASSGFSQNRLFAGLSWKFDTGIVGEVGYLNQFINTEATDFMNHILSINLLLRF